jgi:hypothetical protein
LLAAGAALAAAGRRRAAIAGCVALVLNAPWWVPSVLHPGSTVSDPAAVAAFAARGEGRLGPVLTVLGLGGLWNADAVPGSRNGPLVAVAVVVLCAAAVFGLRVLARRWEPAAVGSLTALAVLGLLLACAGALPGTEAVLRWAVGHLPGAGLLRDGQKWAAWWALPLALGVALAVERLAARVGSTSARAAVFVGAALLPLAILPDLAWGGAGRLQPVRYPPDWGAVNRLVADHPHTGDVLLLPLSTYRRFAWNADRTQLDPAPVALPRTAIGDDTLTVGGVAGGVVVLGEDRRADQVRRALAAGRPLGPLGVGWVLVEHGTPGTTDPALLAALTPVYDGRWLSLYRVPGPVATTTPPAPPAPPVIAADVLALVLVAVALLRQVVPVNIVTSPPLRRWRREG